MGSQVIILRRVFEIIRREGLKAFIRKMLIFIDYKTGIISFISLPYIKVVLRKQHNITSLTDILFNNMLLGLLFRPLQIKEEILELLKLLDKYKPRYILEIGTAQGGTLLLWTRVALEDAVIVSIDLPGGPFGGGYPWLRKFVYKSFARFKQKIVLIRSDSHNEETLAKVIKILRNAKLDFLFIDGDHSYEGVKKDYKMYSTLVRKGGIIAFHDIAEHPPETGCEVKKFWEEVKKYYKYIEIIKDPDQGWAGIGVLFK